MADDLSRRWRTTFLAALQQSANAARLRQAMERGQRGEWTTEMTRVAVEACRIMGWDVAARNHTTQTLPVRRGEYLSIDITAFAQDGRIWRYPTAIMELENNPDGDYIAYNLWKLLCVRAGLRVLYCYRANADDGPPLIRQLAEEVVESLAAQNRALPAGETLIVVGNRAGGDAFPYDYFRWWELDANTRQFRLF